MKLKNLFLIVFFFLVTVLFSCKKNENPVLLYFENAELQYEGKLQKENIRHALNDMLNLSEEELKLKKYSDYTGKEGAWDLPTLIYSHFVPNIKSKTLGHNFYHDVKSQAVQKKIKQLLEKLNQTGEEK